EVEREIAGQRKFRSGQQRVAAESIGSLAAHKFGEENPWVAYELIQRGRYLARDAADERFVLQQELEIASRAAAHSRRDLEAVADALKTREEPGDQTR